MTGAPKPNAAHETQSEQRWFGPHLVVAIILTGYWLLAVSAIATKSTTFDEMAHVTAGYSYWTTNNYQLQPENGNWPQRWVGLPLVLLGVASPQVNPGDATSAMVWQLGRQFLYGVGNDPDRLLLWSRATMGLCGVALGWLVYRVASRLFDRRGAVLSVVLFACCPTMLNLGVLATSDIAASFWFLASTWALWQLLNRLTLQNLLLSSLGTAGLFLTKFSAPILLPIAGILVAVRLVQGAPLAVGCATTEQAPSRQIHGRLTIAAVFLGLAVVEFLVSVSLVWLSYGLRFDAIQDADPTMQRFQFPWENLLNDCGSAGPVIMAVRDRHLLPEAYLYGFTYTLAFSRHRLAFLNGEVGVLGWPSFFPTCLAVKTPLTLAAVLGLAVVATVRRWRLALDRRRAMLDALYRSAPLWALVGVYGVLAIMSHLNIGQRHIAPTYPPLYIAAAAAAAWLVGRTESKPAAGAARRLARFRHPYWAAALLGCMGLFVLESFMTWPNYLAYFNQLVGGSKNGYKHLVDSSLDWGQDLPDLAEWLQRDQREHPETGRAYLSYFGTGSPEFYHVPATLLPCHFDRPREFQTVLEPGVYCISATMLQSLYGPYPGPWNRIYEEAYRQLVPVIEQLHQVSGPPRVREQMIRNDRRFEAFDHLRLGRLTAYLRQRAPDAQVNYSINVYRLTQADIDAALFGPAAELNQLPMGYEAFRRRGASASR